MYSYLRAYRLASEFLENPKVRHHWRNPEKLFKTMGWVLIPYNPFQCPELSTDAYSSYRYDKFFILYYGSQVKTRTNYNFHHETGHIVAGHTILYHNILRETSESPFKKYLEIEATVIGRNVFLNAYIINELIKIADNEEDVKNIFAKNIF